MSDMRPGDPHYASVAAVGGKPKAWRGKLKTLYVPNPDPLCPVRAERKLLLMCAR